MQLWNEVYNIPCDLLNDKLDEIYKIHIVVRCVHQSRLTRHHRITYYQCHRGGKRRSRKKRKVEDVCISTCRRKRKSMKYECEFQIKVMVPLGEKKSSTQSTSMEVQIFVHSKHSGHYLGTEIDKIFYQYTYWFFPLQRRI